MHIKPQSPTGGICQHCGATMVYEDYDPHHFHHGLTCLMCAREQTLVNGLKSLIDPTRRNRRSRVKWEAA
jgi:hypothetical protein